jgi:hypothetical protein
VQACGLVFAAISTSCANCECLLNVSDIRVLCMCMHGSGNAVRGGSALAVQHVSVLRVIALPSLVITWRADTIIPASANCTARGTCCMPFLHLCCVTCIFNLCCHRRLHCRGLSLAPDVDLSALAAGCHGYSGADLAALSREAAMAAFSTAAAQLLSSGEWLGGNWLCLRHRTAVDVWWLGKAS